MRVFRLHIKPDVDDRDGAFEYCRSSRIVGIGWRTARPVGLSPSWEEYFGAVESPKYAQRPQYIRDNVQPGDLIWTRDPHANYFLGRVTSPWEYRNSEEGLKWDILNVVGCTLVKVDTVDHVPGKVIAHFRAPRSIQEVADETVRSYSALLWNKIKSHDDEPCECTATPTDIFACLDAETVEDVIFLYLQQKGWFVFPTTRKGDTMAYEFVAIWPRTTAERACGTRALVQVKTGGTSLCPRDWARTEAVILFQTEERYVRASDCPANVTMLTRAEVETFMRSREEILPAVVNFWLGKVRRAESGPTGTEPERPA